MTRTCPACQRPLTDAGTVCLPCTEALGETLGRVGWLVTELGVTLSRQDAIEGVALGDPELDPVSMPYSVQASGALAKLRRVLSRWCDRLAGGMPATALGHFPGPNPAGQARWLRARLRWLRRLPEAGAAVEELTSAVHHATRVVDRPVELAYGGPCGAVLEDNSYCPDVIWAKPGSGQVQCRRCGAVWDFQARRSNALRAAEDRLESPETIARALTSMGMPLTFDRMRQWRRRGQLVPARVDDRGRARYRLGDVMDLWYRMEHRS